MNVFDKATYDMLSTIDATTIDAATIDAATFNTGNTMHTYTSNTIYDSALSKSNSININGEVIEYSEILELVKLKPLLDKLLREKYPEEFI